MNFIKTQWLQMHSFWKTTFRQQFWHGAIAFFVLLFVGFAVALIFQPLLDFVMNLIGKLMGSLNVYTDEGQLSALGLFINNVRACIVSVVFGFLPFIFLSVIALGVNSLLLGILAAFYVRNGLSLLMYLSALIPHGIFELPALILSFSMGLYLCSQINRMCLHKERTMSLGALLKQFLRIFCFLVIPLLAVAAVIEAFITPMVAGLFF